MTTLQQVKQTQPGWFSLKNKRWFNDVSYKVLHGKATGKPFLIRSTYAWTDMFGSPKRLHYRINHLKENLEIGLLIDKEAPLTMQGHFHDMEDVKDWLKGQ